MHSCSISGNTGLTGGGISIVSPSVGTVTLVSCSISGNVAGGGYSGGGIYISFGSLTLSASSINGNTARGGGGLYMTGSSSYVALNACSINGNIVQGFGGGIEVSTSGNLQITSSSISDNTAGQSCRYCGSEGFGGGMAWSSSGLLTLEAVVFSSNIGLNSGSDLWSDVEPADGSSFTNTTFRSSVTTDSYIMFSKRLPWHPCPGGTWMPLSGTIDFTNWSDCGHKCSAGSYGHTGNVEHASTATCSGPCPKGHWCPEGTADPIPCPAGTFNPAENSAVVEAWSDEFDSNPHGHSPANLSRLRILHESELAAHDSSS